MACFTIICHIGWYYYPRIQPNITLQQQLTLHASKISEDKRMPNVMRAGGITVCQYIHASTNMPVHIQYIHDIVKKYQGIATKGIENQTVRIRITVRFVL